MLAAIIDEMPIVMMLNLKKRYSLLVIVLLSVVFVKAQKQPDCKVDIRYNKDQVGASAMTEIIAPIVAPFKMPQLQRPVFADYKISISDKGAKPGDKVTVVIQQLIDDVSKRGGGTVVVSAGKWHTGRISLKSDVNLEIADGASLYFSGEVEDYRPAVFTRNEGIEVMSLGACIYANGARNIAVTGKGKLIGPAKGGSVRKQIMTKDVIENVVNYKTPVAERIYEGHNGDFIFPPMFISPINCSNVLIEGVSLENTAFWNIVPVYCDSVIIRGVIVNSVGIARGDGIDVESSRNVLIEYTTLSSGDDCFTIKAGRGDDGLRVGIPTENVVVRYCLALEGHGGITCGSETAAMIRNLYVHDCVFENTRTAIRFKTRRPRGGGGENLYYERIKIAGGRYALEWDMLGSAAHVGTMAARYPLREKNHLTPVFRNITASDIEIENMEYFMKASSIPESPLSNVLLKNVKSTTKQLMIATDIDGFEIKNGYFKTDSSVIDLLDVRNFKFNKVYFDNKQQSVEVKVEGDLSDNIEFKKTFPKKPDGWNKAKFRK